MADPGQGHLPVEITGVPLSRDCFGLAKSAAVRAAKTRPLLRASKHQNKEQQKDANATGLHGVLQTSAPTVSTDSRRFLHRIEDDVILVLDEKAIARDDGKRARRRGGHF